MAGSALKRLMAEYKRRKHNFGRKTGFIMVLSANNKPLQNDGSKSMITKYTPYTFK